MNHTVLEYSLANEMISRCVLYRKHVQEACDSRQKTWVWLGARSWYLGLQMNRKKPFVVLELPHT